jgi:dTDP-4-amino-4,6-dideoxygalactose transaminase
LDVDDISEKIDKDTKGVIVVHIGGIVTPRIEEIKKLCDDNNLFLLEDAAHAHGSSLHGKKAGTFGPTASFSFYPTKVMTSGEGGMIVTDDPDVQKKAVIYRDQGKSGFLGNVHVELGYNWRMSELHAVLGLSQLRRLDEFIERRRRMAKIYDERLKDIDGIKGLAMPDGVKSNYYKYIALLDKGIDRGAIKKELKEKYGVSLSGEVYELPCHLQPVFKDLGYKEGDFPVAEDICKRHVCLPVFATMTEDQANYVVDSLKEVLG